MYFGIMLATLALPVAALVAAGWHVRFSRRLARSALVLFLILSATLILIAWPYLKSRDSRGDRPPEVVSHYSALPSDYLNAHFRSRTYGERLRGKPRAERQLFPGLSPIVLGLVGLLPPMSVPTIALTVAGTAAADWSFGFNGLTYKLLYDWVLPYRGLRVPARFSIFVGSILMLLSAFAVRRILQRISSTGTRAIVFGVLVVGVYMDLRPRLVLQGYYPTLPPIYAAVSPNMVLAEFPFGDSEIAYMYFSTYHWARLLDGYSGSVPYHHVWLSTTLEAFPSPSTLALLRQEGATHLTVNCAFYIWPSRCIEVLKQLDSAKSVGLVSRATWEGSEVRLYRLNGSEF